MIVLRQPRGSLSTFLDRTIPGVTPLATETYRPTPANPAARGPASLARSELTGQPVGALVPAGNVNAGEVGQSFAWAIIGVNKSRR